LQTVSIIGYPLGHSASPAIHNAAYEAMSLDARYEAWSVPLEELAGAIERLRGPGMLGMNVTVPYKQAVMPLLDEIDAAARAIGAVNTIVKREGRLVGHNTDAYGFMRSLREAGCDPAGMDALVLGVGGSERAVAYALAEAGARRIALAGRNPQRLEAAAVHLRNTAPRPVGVLQVPWEAAGDAALEAGLIVNCTPVGMKHTPEETASPLDASLLRPGVWVYDLVYNPLETVLLRQAREAGARPVRGLEMLVYQAIAAIELWTGREAPFDIMLSAALRALGLEE